MHMDQGEETPAFLPQGDDTPQGNRENRGAAHGVHRRLFACLPQGARGGLGEGVHRSWGGWGIPCQTFSLQPAMAATACLSAACWCFSFPTRKAGGSLPSPLLTPVPGRVSALRTSSPGNLWYGSSSTVVLQSRVSSSSSDNICMFLLLP